MTQIQNPADGRATVELQSDTHGRQRSLDLLRGLAIAGVLAIHVSQQFPSGLRALDFLFASGWVGVNVYYLVSGWTMCLMWTQREGESRPVRNFYIRRLLRIAPLFWLAIPIYLVARGCGPGPNAPEGIGALQVALTFALLHGFWPDSLNSVVPGDWSIAAEVTFYAIFPCVILNFGAHRRRYIYLAIAIYLFNVVLFKPTAQAIFLNYYGEANATFVKNALHMGFLNQFPIFLTSAFLFFGRRQGFGWADAAALAAWGVLALGADRLNDAHELHYLLINLSLAGFVLGVLHFGLRLAPLEALGHRSYSMYLFHFVVLDALRHLWPLPDGPVSLFIAEGLTTAAAFAIAQFTQRFVEGPANALARRLTARERVAAPVRVREVSGVLTPRTV